MKKLLTILLLSASCYSQNATVSFFYGTQNTLGGEVLAKVNDGFYLGGGYGGVLNIDKTSKDPEKWCNIYAVSSFGYLGDVMVKYRTGLSVYNVGRVDVQYKPLIGISGMYAVSKNYGVEAGLDNFNGLCIGFCAIF